MDLEPESSRDSLIPLAQEKTASRTARLLVAGKFAFVFSHGALAISASAAFGAEHGTVSWWVVFTPVWVGDTLCLVLIAASWCASCPYIQLCLSERQARLGDHNPSILTELLPDIVMAFLGFIFMTFMLVAEVLLCKFLDGAQPRSIVPSTSLFIAASLLSCCRGVCIRASSAVYVSFGGAVLASSVAALCTGGQLLEEHGWLLALPWCASAAGALVAAMRDLRGCVSVLSREERMLRLAEQFLLLEVLAALLVLVFTLALAGGYRRHCGTVAAAGIAVGGGMCTVATLWGRRAVVESRSSSVRERLIIREATEAYARSLL